MAKKVQLTIGGEDIYPLTEAVLVTGLSEAIIESAPGPPLLDITNGITADIRTSIQNAPGTLLKNDDYVYSPVSFYGENPTYNIPRCYWSYNGGNQMKMLDIDWDNLRFEETYNWYIQSKLIGSGTNQNIKTVNGNNILGSGNVSVGTVTSVSAGTGLSIGGNSTTTPTVNIASNYKLPTTDEWNSKANLWSPSFTGTPTATTAAAGTNTTQIATTAFVKTAIDNLPEPMIFKGSLGTGGTITSLPTASSENEGFVYKVITEGTYAGKAAKVGDTFVCGKTGTTTYEWVLIPSGDEPSGTVTSVGISSINGDLNITGSPITSSGTMIISHSNSVTPDTAGTSSATSGSTLAIPYVTYDGRGHVTASGTHTHTITGFSSLEHMHSTIIDSVVINVPSATALAYGGKYVLITGGGSEAYFNMPSLGTTAGTACAGNDSRLSDTRTPKAHASTATTYGIGSSSNYGHVKILTGDLNGATATDGVAAASSHTHSQYLTSHQNIKTVNGNSLIGLGNVSVGTVTKVNVGVAEYTPTSGVISLPAYPVTLPASDVYAWAKAANKPSYTLDEVSDGSTRKLSNYLPLTGGILSNSTFGAQLTIERTGGANMAAIGFKNTSGNLGFLATNTVNGAFVRYNANADNYWTILDSSNSSVSLSGSTLSVKINGTTKSLTNTTYESKAAASGGTAVSLCTTGEKYTWNSKSNLAIGTTATTAAAGNHTHSTTIATSSGTNQITLAANTKYAITAGGTSYVFTTPPDGNTDTKVSQSATTTDRWRKVILGYQTGAAPGESVGNYTDVVYGTTGIEAQPSTGTLSSTVLRASGNNLYVGSASNSQCHQQYDATNKCLKFIFD